MLTGKGSSQEIQDNPAFVRAKLADIENNHPMTTPSGRSLKPSEYTGLVDVTSDIWPAALVLQYTKLALQCVAPVEHRPTMDVVVKRLQQQVIDFIRF